MKVKDLIEKLLQCDPELPVRLFTDHGQSAMTPFEISVAYIEEDEYMADLAEEKDEGAVKVVLIDA